jgi:hypothetical protein
MMTPEELQQFNNLKKFFEEFVSEYYRNRFSALEIKDKNIQFKSKVGFFSIEPVSQQAAISSPSTPGATYSQAVAQSAKDAIDAIITELKNLGLTA